MSYRNFLPIVEKITRRDKYQVAGVINHAYKLVKMWTNDPHMKARIIIPELGAFELNKIAIDSEIKTVIKGLRKYKDQPEIYEVFKQFFRVLWNLKQLRTSYDRKMKLKYNPNLRLKGRRAYAKEVLGIDLVNTASEEGKEIQQRIREYKNRFKTNSNT